MTLWSFWKLLFDTLEKIPSLQLFLVAIDAAALFSCSCIHHCVFHSYHHTVLFFRHVSFPLFFHRSCLLRHCPSILNISVFTLPFVRDSNIHSAWFSFLCDIIPIVVVMRTRRSFFYSYGLFLLCLFGFWTSLPCSLTLTLISIFHVTLYFSAMNRVARWLCHFPEKLAL